MFPDPPNSAEVLTPSPARPPSIIREDWSNSSPFSISGFPSSLHLAAETLGRRVPTAQRRRPAKPKMTVVGAILRYSHIEPTFENSSHGQSPSVRPASRVSAEDPALFVVLPNHHIWAPHTRQRAVFSTSSRSRASTTVVVEHHCPNGCRGHPSYVDGIHVPLLRKVGDVPRPERSRRRSWQHFQDCLSQVLPHRLCQDAPDTESASAASS